MQSPLYRCKDWRFSVSPYSPNYPHMGPQIVQGRLTTAREEAKRWRVSLQTIEIRQLRGKSLFQALSPTWKPALPLNAPITESLSTTSFAYVNHAANYRSKAYTVYLVRCKCGREAFLSEYAINSTKLTCCPHCRSTRPTRLLPKRFTQTAEFKAFKAMSPKSRPPHWRTALDLLNDIGAKPPGTRLLNAIWVPIGYRRGHSIPDSSTPAYGALLARKQRKNRK